MSKFKVGDEVTSTALGGLGWITEDAGVVDGMQRWFVSWRDPVQRTGRFGWAEEDLVLLTPDEVGRSPHWTPAQEAALKQSIGEYYAGKLPAGPTKREWLARQALGALIDREYVSAVTIDGTAFDAVRYADALLAELAKA